MPGAEFNARPEAQAKINLLNFMRAEGRLEDATIMSELTVENAANRADLVVSSSELVCFEIKTENDSLVRLDRQIARFSRCFERVYVACASRHLKNVMRIVPDYIGLLELRTGQAHGSEVGRVREALPSPARSVTGLLSLLPLSEIRSRFTECRALKKRAQIEFLAGQIEYSFARSVVNGFIENRYKDSSDKFLRAAEVDFFQADIRLLSAWSKEPTSQNAGINLQSRFDLEYAVYSHIGGSFGSVPDDIKHIFENAQSFHSSSNDGRGVVKFAC